ncbi:hypothetical protein DL93DRAFT_2076980 [Clavulina sp. PMI_390]|nr:hypothetical protein DL93DRAFT_2076980 [Clavulina sp. PMI_390]
MRFLDLRLTPLLTLIASSRIVVADTCTNVDGDLVIDGTVYGHLNGCLCSAALPNLIASDPLVKTAAAATSIQDVWDALHALIISPHDAYIPPADRCPPNSPLKIRKPSPTELSRDRRQCEFGVTKCGVPPGIYSSSPSSPTESKPGHSAVSPYQCIDTMFNLQSCGGCIVPHTNGLSPYEIGALPAGVDCAAKPGVSDVECRMGHCIVHQCKKGYKRKAVLHESGEALFECVPKRRKASVIGSLHKQIGGVLQRRGD